jgi:hypothetical protein
MTSNSTISAIRHGNIMLVIVIAAIVVALSFDTSIVRLSPIIGEINYKLTVFIVITTVYAVGQYLILGLVREKNTEIRSKQSLQIKLIHRILMVVQSVLVTICIFVILQLLTLSSYSSAILVAATGISYSLATVMMAVLAKRFFSWFKSNRNNLVLMYGFSAVSIAINTAITLAFTFTVAANIPAEMLPRVASVFQSPPRGSLSELFNNAYVVSSIASFFATWIATAMFLRHHSQRIGKAIYWIIVSIPLAFFLSQFSTSFLDLLAPLQESDPLAFYALFTFIYLLSKSLGGILFAIAFFDVAKHMQHSTIKKYMVISACGFILFFVSNQAAATFIRLSYPPFGIASISTIGLSSYLILVGIYSSVISASQDVKLRKLIEKSVAEQSGLLKGLTKGQVEQELQKRMTVITRNYSDKLTEETGISPSLTDNEVKQYMQEVLREVGKVK